MPVGIGGVDDRLGLIGSLSFVRLHRTHVVLVVRSIGEEEELAMATSRSALATPTEVPATV